MIQYTDRKKNYFFSIFSLLQSIYKLFVETEIYTNSYILCQFWIPYLFFSIKFLDVSLRNILTRKAIIAITCIADAPVPISPYSPPPPKKKMIMIIMINASCANVGFYSRLSAEFLGYSYISFSNLFRSGWIPIYCYACNVLNVTYWARKKLDQFGIYHLIHETYPGEIPTSLSWKKGYFSYASVPYTYLHLEEPPLSCIGTASSPLPVGTPSRAGS